MSRRRRRTAADARADTAAPVVRTRAAALPPAGTGGDAASLQLLRGLEVDRLLAARAEARARGGLPSRLGSSGNPLRVTLPVAGMTCRSCEVRIQRYVSRVPHVVAVRASAVHGRVEIEASTPIAPGTLARAISAAGYEVGGTPWLVRDPAIWATAVAGLALVAVLAVLAEATGVAGLASGAGDLSSGGLLVALLRGLVAGGSTCMALVGGLVLALSASFQSQRGETDRAVGARLRPAIVFVAGRVVGYGLFGALLGSVGATVSMPPQLTAALMIAVAGVMMLLGTRLTGLSPRMAAWSPTLPMGLGRRLGLGDGIGGAYSDTRAAALGAASFFLPCGFTQAIQIYALSTGSPLLAGALLATFAIGTAPGLFALAGLPVVVPDRFRPTLIRLVGVVVLGFAMTNGSAGLRLSGIGLPSLVGFAAAAPLPGTLGLDGVQTITTYQNAAGYSPGNVVIYAGYPTRWTVESSTTSTCAASLWIPGLDIRARLERGSNTFLLPALRAGTLQYTCAMGMYGGRITVVDRPPDAAGEGKDG